MTAYTDLKRGDCIRVAFGARNSQLAVVHDVTKAGNVRVWKFSASRGVWKGPLAIYPRDFMNLVDKAAVGANANRRTDYADPAKNALHRATMKAAGL